MSAIRTSTLQTTNTMMDYITSSETKYNNLALEASSGIKVATPSDDPSAAKSILNVKSQLSKLNDYLKNMSTTQNELNTLDSTFSSLTKNVQDVIDYATQGANGTYTNTDLSSIKSQIDSIIGTITSIANTQYNGTYIFSGTATSTPAYTTAADGSITYAGNTDSRYTTIADGVSVATNAIGSSVFGSYTAASGGTPASGSGLFYTLKTLSNALGTGDSATISSSISSLNTELETITGTQTKFGAVTNKFTMTTDTTNSMVTTLKSYKSDLQDADITQVYTDLATQQTALNASMKIASQMLSGKSLLDYI